MVRIYGVTGSSGGSGGGGGNAPGVQLSGITESDSSIYLTTDGFGIENLSNIVSIPANSTALIKMQIIAKTEASPTKTASWDLTGVIKKDSSSSSIQIVGMSPVSVMSDPEMVHTQISLSENLALGGISIQCTGISNYTVIKWAATITLTEV